MDELLAARIAASHACGWADAEIAQLAPPVRGTSGAIVSFLYSSNVELARCTVKCVRSPRISLAEEAARREIIAPYLGSHVPTVLWVGKISDVEAMVCECPAASTMQQRFATSDSLNLQNVWQNFIDAIISMWLSSRTDFEPTLCPRPFDERMKRIQDGILAYSIHDVRLRDVFHLPSEINGEECPSLSSAIEIISNISPPPFGVTCQGDPQPANILVGDDLRWHLIDWEWAGRHHDLRMMLSHLRGWWVTRFLENSQAPSLTTYPDRIVLTYESRLTDKARSFQVLVDQALELLEPYMSGQDSWAINRFLAALYLGNMRFEIGQRTTSSQIPLIGEALRIAQAVKLSSPELLKKDFGVTAWL